MATTTTAMTRTWWDLRRDRRTRVPPARRRLPPPLYDADRDWAPLHAAVQWARKDVLLLRASMVLDVADWYAARPSKTPPRQMLRDLATIATCYDHDDLVIRAAAMLTHWPRR